MSPNLYKVLGQDWDSHLDFASWSLSEGSSCSFLRSPAHSQPFLQWNWDEDEGWGPFYCCFSEDSELTSATFFLIVPYLFQNHLSEYSTLFHKGPSVLIFSSRRKLSDRVARLYVFFKLLRICPSQRICQLHCEIDAHCRCRRQYFCWSHFGGKLGPRLSIEPSGFRQDQEVHRISLLMLVRYLSAPTDRSESSSLTSKAWSSCSSHSSALPETKVPFWHLWFPRKAAKLYIISARAQLCTFPSQHISLDAAPPFLPPDPFWLSSLLPTNPHSTQHHLPRNQSLSTSNFQSDPLSQPEQK